jgi:CheY-like chemotaxis protein
MNNSNNGKTMIEILLVEDNPGDVDLTKAALRRCKVLNHVTVAVDGEEALAILRQQGQHADAPRPHVVLLDLNLPKKSGIEVLAEIKTDAALRQIPVVIMTSSKAEEDIVKTYDCHANCYVNKPVDLDEFRKVVQAIEGFWFTLVKLPPAPPATPATVSKESVCSAK